MNSGQPQRLVLYDGVCGLCDHTIQTLIAIDKKGVLHYAPLQGDTAAAVQKRNPQIVGIDSIAFVLGAGTERERVYLKSQAVMIILRELGGIWWVVSLLRAIPRVIRDAVYDFVARNRYKWFGKFDACKMPEPGLRARFLP